MKQRYFFQITEPAAGFPLAMGPGSKLASASLDGTAKVRDVSKGVAAVTFAGHKGPVTGLAFGPAGQWVASASRDKTVRQ